MDKNRWVAWRPGDKHLMRRYLMGWVLLAGSLFGFLSCATAGENAARRDLNQHAESFATSSKSTARQKASEAPSGSLESYIAYAMENSPELSAQFERWQASVLRISKARRLPDPVISYAYYISKVETRVGPQRHRLSLKQTFPWPTRLSAGADAASARAKSQQEKFDAQAIAIASKVEQTYWRIWAIQESRKIKADHETVLAGLSESANAMIMTGRIELADQQQIDLARARVDDALSVLDEQLAQQKALLRGIISAPPEMKIAVTSVPNLEKIELDEASLLSSVKSHPSLRVYASLAESSALEAKKEETTRYPNFTVGVDWIETGDAQNPDTPESGKDALMAGIGVSIPLWQRNYKEGVEAWHAEEKAHLADGEAATDKAVAMFYQTLSQIRDAQRRIALYEKTLVPQAESVYESVLGAYASGRGNVAAILLAQQELLELRLQLISAQAESLVHMAMLKNIVGRELTQKTSDSASIKEGDKP